MHHCPTAELDPRAEFGRRLDRSLADGTFVRLVLSGAIPGTEAPEKVLGRWVELKGQPHLSLTLRRPTRDEVQNLPVLKSAAWVLERLGTHYRNALLCTVQCDWQLTLPEGKRARLIRHQASQTVPPSREHDQAHRSLLDASAQDWLSGLGITDDAGKVRPAMADKYAQINRYLEIFSHLAADAGWIGTSAKPEAADEWTIADMGCGKGYLTFGLWHLCRRVWRLPARVLGVEARADLVACTNQVAEWIGAKELRFERGQIESAELPSLRALIALHACDTATDEAIRRGIGLGAQLIVVAPCCHKQLRPQLGRPAPLAPVLRHGVMEERMAEWATDGLRALFLEWAGYRTKMFEFVSSEHTPKNLMISAVRETKPADKAAALVRIQGLKEFFGIQHHALDPLLNQTGAER
jgi:SAM-dependent methyltransferase